MFRMTKRTDGTRMIVVVDGEFGGEGVAEVETLCEQELLAGRKVDLELRDLTGIDRTGIASLKRLLSQGVQVQARGVYDSYVVQVLRVTTASGKATHDWSFVPEGRPRPPRHRD